MTLDLVHLKDHFQNILLPIQQNLQTHKEWTNAVLLIFEKAYELLEQKDHLFLSLKPLFKLSKWPNDTYKPIDKESTSDLKEMEDWMNKLTSRATFDRIRSFENQVLVFESEFEKISSNDFDYDAFNALGQNCLQTLLELQKVHKEQVKMLHYYLESYSIQQVLFFIFGDSKLKFLEALNSLSLHHLPEMYQHLDVYNGYLLEIKNEKRSDELLEKTKSLISFISVSEPKTPYDQPDTHELLKTDLQRNLQLESTLKIKTDLQSEEDSDLSSFSFPILASVVANRDYLSAEAPEELIFRKGEKLKVIQWSRRDSWWCINEEGEEGYVSSHLCDIQNITEEGQRQQPPNSEMTEPKYSPPYFSDFSDEKDDKSPVDKFDPTDIFSPLKEYGQERSPYSPLVKPDKLEVPPLIQRSKTPQLRKFNRKDSDDDKSLMDLGRLKAKLEGLGRTPTPPLRKTPEKFISNSTPVSPQRTPRLAPLQELKGSKTPAPDLPLPSLPPTPSVKELKLPPRTTSSPAPSKRFHNKEFQNIPSAVQQSPQLMPLKMEYFDNIQQEMIPPLVLHCVKYLKERGLKEEGIFRVPGDMNEIQKYYLMYREQSNDLIKDILDPLLVAGILKYYFKSTTDSPITKELETALLPTFSKQDTLFHICATFQTRKILPEPHYETLKLLFGFFVELIAYERWNKMNARNLSRVFGMSLFRGEFPVDLANRLLDVLIKNYQLVFSV